LAKILAELLRLAFETRLLLTGSIGRLRLPPLGLELLIRLLPPRLRARLYLER